MERIEQLGKEIIKNLEESRIFFNDKVKYYQDNNNNPFRTGWCSSFFVRLNNEAKTIQTDIFCHLFEEHSHNGKERPLGTDIQGLLDSRDNRDGLVAILQPWLEKTVRTEEYGGFYYEELEIDIYLKYGDEIRLKADDEKRKATYLANVKEFIEKEQYKTADLKKMHTNLKELAFTIITVFYPSIGLAKVENIFDVLENRLKDDRHFDEILAGAKKALYDASMYEDGKRKSDPALLDMACYICILLIRNGEDYQSVLQSLAKDCNYRKAADIIKFGSGKFSKDDVFHKDNKLSCLANDVTRLVDIKFKSFDTEACNSAVNFLTKLVDMGFPQEYSIKSNIQGKEYLPLSELGKTQANKFWRSFEKYPETFPSLEKYIRATMESGSYPYTYYSDAEEEKAVPVGGYAVFVLGLYAPQKYADVITEFLDDADYEHALTVRHFFDKIYNNLDREHQKQIEGKRYW